MLGNRSKFEEIIYKGVWDVTRSKENVQIYKDLFATMNDKQLAEFVLSLENQSAHISIVVPNFQKDKPTVKEIMEVAEKLGHKFFEKLYVEGKEGLPTYLTPVEYLVLLTPVRRASQILTKKISVPAHNKVRDALTGQVTGESKGARVSGDEIQLAAAMGMENSMVEMVKYRGGDLRGGAALTAMLSKYGKASQGVLKQYASGVVSTNTLNTFLTCAMHRVKL